MKSGIIIFCLILSLSGCVQIPEISDENSALIMSNYPVVNVNGDEIEQKYRLDIKSGENTLVIVYNTYQYDYFCTFTWQAEAGKIYEVTDQENRYPLTLYQWKKKNRLWAQRLYPVDPIQCTRKQRNQDNSVNKES